VLKAILLIEAMSATMAATVAAPPPPAAGGNNGADHGEATDDDQDHACHLARSAIVYVRQSTPNQSTNNLESQRRQDGLAERGRQLGWSDVQVIEDGSWSLR
jgi:hypothetical protein